MLYAEGAGACKLTVIMLGVSGVIASSNTLNAGATSKLSVPFKKRSSGFKEYCKLHHDAGVYLKPPSCPICGARVTKYSMLHVCGTMPCDGSNVTLHAVARPIIPSPLIPKLDTILLFDKKTL